MAGGIYRAGKLVDFENARIRAGDALCGFVERDVPVYAYAAVAYFDSSGVLYHLREVFYVFGGREDNLIFGHHEIRPYAVEEQRPDLPAEAQRVAGGNELVPLVVHVFVHKEKADVFEAKVAVVDFLRHYAVGLRGADGHYERHYLAAACRLFKFVHHLLRKKFVYFVERVQNFELPVRLPYEFVRVEGENPADFLPALFWRHQFHFFPFPFSEILICGAANAPLGMERLIICAANARQGKSKKRFLNS